MSQAIVYLIRHGEKPEPEADGLSPQGLERSQALPGVFGPQSSYNIRYILAEHPKKGEPLRCVYPAFLILSSFANTSVKAFQVHINSSIHE
jgi:hypothetical protein